MSDLKRRFPEPIPMEEIRIDEEHTFEVIEYEDGSTSTKTRYIPDKAPFTEVESITGYVNSNEVTFSEGIDYELIDTNNDGRLDTIDFAIGGRSPDANTVFEVIYIAPSIISRYVDSYQNEFERLEGDIETVIASRNVDRATDTGYIDNFEDEELVEYDILEGTESMARVRSDVTRVDDWALEILPETDDDTILLASDFGLNRYPRRGDTISYYTKITSESCTTAFDFMWHPNEDGQDDYYRVRICAYSDELILRKQDGTQKRSALSVDMDPYIDTWLRIEIEIGALGNVTATLFDENDIEVASTSITDTAYSNGGIRFYSTSSTPTYFDGVEVIQRNTDDLDRIGALFGELGRRRGRTDQEYVQYLKSIVQSFSGRGTVDGILFAVTSALDIDTDQVFIIEDFENNEYEIVFDSWPDHNISTVFRLADLADPSGVEHVRNQYNLDRDISESSDTVSSAVEPRVSDDSDSSDVLTQVITDSNRTLLKWNGNAWNEFNWNEYTDGSEMQSTDQVEVTVTEL